MKLSEMAEKVSKVSGTDAVTARKVIRALFQSVAEDIGTQERTAIQGFGSFIKRKMKDGEERTTSGPREEYRHASCGFHQRTLLGSASVLHI